MTLFIVSLAVFIVSLILIISVKFFDKRLRDTFLGPIGVVFLLISGIFGLGIVQIVVPYKNVYEQVYNCDIIKSDNAIFIDLSNSSAQNKFRTYPLKKFNSYKIVTNYSDSTRFYIKERKSFYGVPIETYVVWSNPPYSRYNSE